ncbi:MAG: plastocyanin/azurin family copper-binding protein [Nitriliruptoraceae bacterium]
MRHQIALVIIAIIVAAGCTPAAEDGASNETDEVSASNDSEELEPGPGETGSAAEPTESATPGDVAATDDTDDDDATAATVTIRDFSFEPDALAIQVGDTVTWTHEGDLTHNVTARDGSFASENLGTGQTFTHTFTEAGSFEYRCTLHGQMIATLDVS